MMLAFLVLIGGTDEQGDDGINGAGAQTLDTHRVPPDYLEWVSRAGAVCADVSAPLVAAQIEAESNWNPRATSPVGAKGMSQFMPGTWQTWGVDSAGKNGQAKPDGVADPFTPGDAIMTQARYDCWLARKVKSYRIPGDTVRLMLAAYNAGPDAVRSFRGVPPYPETQAYVSRILTLKEKYSKAEAGTGEGEATTFGLRVAAYAKKWLGTPYSWGGGSVEGPGYGTDGRTRGFDCSALVQYAVYHASAGRLTLPRVSQSQATEGQAVKPADIAVGDVIAFALNGAGDWDHIGIYVGGGQFIHAPKTGDVVKISQLNDDFYRSKPKTIRRLG